MTKPNILAFAGSTRSTSFNLQLTSLAAARAGESGAEVTLVNLREFSMPLYDEDLEKSEGLPPNAIALYDLMKSHDGVLLSSPEFNGSISGALKNTIDWVSRPREGDDPLSAFTGKVCGLMSASPGALGGMRGLVHVRAILSSVGMLVLPQQVAVGKAHEAFDDNGSLNDSRTNGMLDSLVKSLVTTTKRLHSTD